MKLIAIATIVIAGLALGACGTKTVPGPTRYITNDVPGPTVYVTPQACKDAVVDYGNTVSGFINSVGGHDMAWLNAAADVWSRDLSTLQKRVASACGLHVTP